jgi:hypothetical protein
MNIPEKLKQLAREGRAILQPIGYIPDHMARLTSWSAKEMGFSSDVAALLAESARETCQESGLIGSTHSSLDGH